MAAGVGKTFAMLSEAHRLQKQGKKVLVGVVETHGRKETEALLDGLKVLPRVKREHRGKSFTEMDLDQILVEKPDVVLVDELAHTNVTGSRHEKRYQDVEEILAAGISVYTTVNVQHLESRKVVVEEMTGIRVHETVPDVFLDQAKEISLIDLDPDELLRRMDAGKIYAGNKTETAKSNFFTKVNLKALRELALRFMANHVERDLFGEKSMQGLNKTFKTAPRLEVAVYASPYSEILLRWTKMLADSMGGTWVAAYIDDGSMLSHEERTLLTKNFALVNSLGGELVTTIDSDPVDGLLRVAQQNHVNLIVVGKSQRSLLSQVLGKPNVTARLLKESGDIDVFVLSSEGHGGLNKPKPVTLSERVQEPIPLGPLGQAAAILVATWIMCAFLESFLGYRAVGLLFLLAVFAGSLLLNRSSILILAFAAGLIWDVFFIPPLFSLTIKEPEDLMMLIIFFVAALVMGNLTHRLRIQERRVLQREERAQTLYRITRNLGAARTRSEVFKAIAEALSSALKVPASVLIVAPDSANQLEECVGSFPLNTKERAVANWVYLNRKAAGAGTETLTQALGLYLPLVVSDRVEAVLAIDYSKVTLLRHELDGLVDTIGQLASVALERENFREHAVELQVLRRTQTLHDALFDSVSHELKTPLSAIQGSVSAMLEDPLDDRQRELTGIIAESSERLQQTVENMLDMSRIESGMLKPCLEVHDVCDVVNGPLREWYTRPIIILSVKNLESQIVEALDSGADDYLTKPFQMAELKARIRVALRNSGNHLSVEPVFESGPLRVDLATRKVTVDHSEVKLTSTQYDLLKTLIRHAGRVLTHRQLLKEVWGPNASEQTQYLRVYINQLRQKIESDPHRPQLLLTESGVGYRLVLNRN
jgi:two-component system sensor histidine kinase KdpD